MELQGVVNVGELVGYTPPSVSWSHQTLTGYSLGSGLIHAGPLLAFGLDSLIARQDTGASEGM